MPLTSQDVRDKKFSRAFKGYSDTEVDAFLDEVVAEFERLYQIINGLKARCTKTETSLQEYTQMEKSLRSVMVLADQAAKQLVDDAHAQADSIVANSRAEGEKVVEGLQVKIMNTRNQLQSMEGQVTEFGLTIRDMIEQQEAFLSVQKHALAASLAGEGYAPAALGQEERAVEQLTAVASSATEADVAPEADDAEFQTSQEAVGDTREMPAAGA